MSNPNIKPLGEAQWVRMALVAASGYGKTVFAGTAPNALFLTTDPEGTASAKELGSTAKEWRVNNTDDMQDAFVYLEQGGVKAEGLEWLIIDNVSEAQRHLMDWAMMTAVDLAVKKKEFRNPYVPDQREYLIEQNGLLSLVRKMNSLPVNIIYTAHRVGREDGDANDYYSVDIRGKKGEIAEAFLGYMNIIGMGEVLTIKDEEVRRLYFSHRHAYRGKDRYNKLGPFRDNLTVPEMMRIIKEGKVTRPRPRPRPAS
jgi:hypothetical protein